MVKLFESFGALVVIVTLMTLLALIFSHFMPWLAGAEFPTEVEARPGEWVAVHFACEPEFSDYCNQVTEWRLYQQTNNENAPSVQVDAVPGPQRALQMQVPQQGARWFLKVRGVVAGVVGPASEEMLVTRKGGPGQ